MIALFYSAIVFMKAQRAAYLVGSFYVRTSLHNNKKPSEKLKGNYLYPRIKRHAKMVLIGLNTTTAYNQDTT